MNPRLLEAALKRERLVERSNAQRARLAGTCDGLQRLCAAGDRVVAAGHKVQENPHWVGLAALALVIVKPRRAWKIARTGYLGWRAWVAIRKRLPAHGARPAA